MTAVDERAAPRDFRHEALLYASEAEFVAGTVGFIREGMARGEAILTVVAADKIGHIRSVLHEDADRVLFADMAKVGHNPTLIIQAWRDFVAAHRDAVTGMRGIGEPITAQRNDAALVECHIHEALLNVAFAAEPNFWLLCPYDTQALPPRVVERAVGNHPFVCGHGNHIAGSRHPAGEGEMDALDEIARPLPPPRGRVETIAFHTATLRSLRQWVTTRALEGDVRPDRVSDLVVAVSEVATNAIVHGEGDGEADLWLDDDYLLCDVRSAGNIRDPLVGRLRPVAGQDHGYGMWLANQFCDLVQVRSIGTGTVVRLHIRREPRSEAGIPTL